MQTLMDIPDNLSNILITGNLVHILYRENKGKTSENKE